MKPLNKIVLIPFAALTLCAANTVETKYTLSNNYSVAILGTSNLHNWSETVKTVAGECNASWNSDGSFNLEALSLKMQVHSIQSDMGSIMNNNTYKALKADANPEITFILTAPLQSVNASTGTIISAKANLTIAGVTNPVTMQVKVNAQTHGELSFEGTQTVKMTDYGVNPPTALFGTLKTGNEITIVFKVNFTTTISS